MFSQVVKQLISTNSDLGFLGNYFIYFNRDVKT